MPLLLATAAPACAAAGAASLCVASAAPVDALEAPVLTRLKGLHGANTALVSAMPSHYAALSPVSDNNEKQCLHVHDIAMCVDTVART